MRSSLFGKILMAFITVIILTMSVVGWFQLYMVKNYLLESKEREMIVRGQDLAKIIKPLLIAGENPREIVFSFNRADRILGTEVWVVNSTGKVLVASADHTYCEGNTLEATDLQKLQAGQITIRRGQSQYFKEAVIRVVNPILHQGKLLGAVILYSPVRGVNQAFDQMRAIHVGSALLGIILSILLGWWLSRYIARPITEVSEGAERIAQGDFQNRVRVTSADELGRMGMAFNNMARKLENYEKLRREFVANVSHELRSPLTSIQGFVTAILEDKNPSQQKKYLQIISKETQRVSKLVTELLEISRYDAGVEPFSMEPFPISNVVKRATNSLKPLAEEANQHICLQIPAKLPDCYGDEDKIEQVVHNLLANALRYSQHGTSITIAAHVEDKQIKVTVTDEGPGIPQNALPRLWERFYRVEQGRSREMGGSGLGLAIVDEIIKKHQGSVAVHSVEGQGSTFSFTLPLAHESPEE